MTKIRKVGLAVFRDHKILMVKTTKGNIRFLGGKVDDGETDIACLVREVKEEVNSDLNIDSLKLLNVFSAPTKDDPDVTVEMPLYKGELISEPSPSSEVVEIVYEDSGLDDSHKTPLTTSVFDWLKASGFIN